MRIKICFNKILFNFAKKSQQTQNHKYTKKLK